MNNNPLSHVGQTARPEESASDAGAEARQRSEADALTKASGPPAKEIPDLEPGEPPPESSAGS